MLFELLKPVLMYLLWWVKHAPNALPYDKSRLSKIATSQNMTTAM